MFLFISHYTITQCSSTVVLVAASSYPRSNVCITMGVWTLARGEENALLVETYCDAPLGIVYGRGWEVVRMT